MAPEGDQARHGPPFLLEPVKNADMVRGVAKFYK
jgi:hypothetical protein